MSTEKKQRRESALASSITRRAYGRTLFALRLLKNPTRQWEEMFDQQPAPVYDDDRFDGTRDLVTARLRSEGIRVWVLYNAHLLDSRTMEHILGTWKKCDKQFSVMLIGKSSPIGVEQQVLKDQMDSQPSLKFYKAPQIELRRVSNHRLKAVA